MTNAIRYASNSRGAQYRITGTATDLPGVVKVETHTWCGDRWERAMDGIEECAQAVNEVIAEVDKAMAGRQTLIETADRAKHTVDLTGYELRIIRRALAMFAHGPNGGRITAEEAADASELQDFLSSVETPDQMVAA